MSILLATRSQSTPSFSSTSPSVCSPSPALVVYTSVYGITTRSVLLNSDLPSSQFNCELVDQPIFKYIDSDDIPLLCHYFKTTLISQKSSSKFSIRWSGPLVTNQTPTMRSSQWVDCVCSKYDGGIMCLMVPTKYRTSTASIKQLTYKSTSILHQSSYISRISLESNNEMDCTQSTAHSNGKIAMQCIDSAPASSTLSKKSTAPLLTPLLKLIKLCIYSLLSQFRFGF